MVIGILDVVAAVRLGAGKALHFLPAPLLFICVDTRPSTVPFAIIKMLMKGEGMRGHLRRVRAARRVRVFHARRVRGHYDLDSCKAKRIGDHCGQPPFKYFCQCTQPVLQWKPHWRKAGPVMNRVVQISPFSSIRCGLDALRNTQSPAPTIRF